MTPAAKIILILAAFLGFFGILLGALGAHALEETLLERGTESAWNTAVLYHLFHTVALLAAGVWLRSASGHLLAAAATCWLAGTLAFSGSLYWLSLGGPGFLGPITPLGGLVLMAGWLLSAIAAWRSS